MPRSESEQYRLRLIGTAVAAVVGAVAIGLLPRCDSIQTRALAHEQHESIRRECTESGKSIMNALDKLTLLVLEGIREKGEPHE